MRVRRQAPHGRRPQEAQMVGNTGTPLGTPVAPCREVPGSPIQGSGSGHLGVLSLAGHRGRLSQAREPGAPGTPLAGSVTVKMRDVRRCGQSLPPGQPCPVSPCPLQPSLRWAQGPAGAFPVRGVMWPC